MFNYFLNEDFSLFQPLLLEGIGEKVLVAKLLPSEYHYFNIVVDSSLFFEVDVQRGITVFSNFPSGFQASTP